MSTTVLRKKTVLAPYFYSWGAGNPAYKVQSLVDAHKKVSLSAATVAFVLSGGAGRVNPEISLITPDILAFQKLGGRVILSFGGANGPYLEESVKTPQELFTLWEKLLVDTGVKSFDFDVEGFYLSQNNLNVLRRDALKLLQAKRPDIYISFTLAVMPPDAWGNASLPPDGVKLLEDLTSANVRFDLVNCMTMDYGNSFATKNQGQLAIDIAESLKCQLAKMFPKKTASELYAMIGLTPMIGKNDDANFFRVEDAVKVASYAHEKNLGLLSYWALQRDQCGTGSLAIYSLGNKKDFEFYHAFWQVAGPNAPAQEPTAGGNDAAVNPNPKPNVAPVILKPVKGNEWTVGAAFKVGDTVSYNGIKYTCLNPNTSQSDWAPQATASLWKRQ